MVCLTGAQGCKEQCGTGIFKVPFSPFQMMMSMNGSFGPAGKPGI